MYHCFTQYDCGPPGLVPLTTCGGGPFSPWLDRTDDTIRIYISNGNVTNSSNEMRSYSDDR